MKRAFAIFACVVCLCGCASTNDIHHLTYHQTLKLVKAVDIWATVGGPAPEEVQKLKPLQVYNDNGNVVIVLKKDDHEEKGYYIVPAISSFDPRFRSNGNWTYKPLDFFDPYLQSIYEYTRTF